MHKPPHVIEIFLNPGELYFGDRDTRMRTVLGSCVSLTFWHPELLVGGMCHYMLPQRAKARAGEALNGLDGRYADEAIALMIREVDALDVPHREFEVKLFGGGNMFPERTRQVDHVGQKNVQVARSLVRKHGFNCVAEHLGGDGHRNIIFDVWSGDVWVRHTGVVRQDAHNNK
ncbi:MAG: chemotaxis protein CheD [Pseudomonadota bacterium]